MTNCKSIFRTIVFSLLPLLILVVLLEIGIRARFYYLEGPNSFAVIQGYDAVRWRILKKLAERKVTTGPDFAKDHDIRELFARQRLLETNLGQRLYDHYQEKYETYFSLLSETINNSGAVFCVLYLDLSRLTGDYSENMFFRQLAGKYGALFVDMNSTFSKYDYKAITLMPINGHLSRFGNRLVAVELLKTLDEFKGHRASIKFKTRPKLLGDLTPNSDRIWLYRPEMPYRVATNSQGLRMKADLEFPAVKQRILFLGDSFTFGPYLDNHDTYPALIQELDREREYINAGISGYSIVEQTGLFIEKAKYIEPDIVVLQVLDNDILSGMTTYKMNRVLRNKKVYEYSGLEIEYIREQLGDTSK